MENSSFKWSDLMGADQSGAEVDKLYREFSNKSISQMLDDQQTYGEASDAPEFLNQDGGSFHKFMKTADQDLQWQCETVAASFRKYMLSGEVPAPYYPMRVAILLSKAKDFDRERKFLAAWCKHFPAGNGATYAALVRRAEKTGAFNVINKQYSVGLTSGEAYCHVLAPPTD